MSKMGRLYLIPTVLAEGTAEKVLSPQIKDIISIVDHFFVEEVRTARRFISSLKLGKPIESLKFYDLNKDTTKESFQRQFEQIPKGVDIGVISEAGCPGIADPGSMAVEFAHKIGMEVIPLVGPSSILLALMGSGFNGQSFCFHGYLPIDKIEKVKMIKNLERDSKMKGQTQIFMETPYRNMKMLEEILPVLSGDTKICIASGITASNQLILTKKAKEWMKSMPNIHKVPAIFILEA